MCEEYAIIDDLINEIEQIKEKIEQLDFDFKFLKQEKSDYIRNVRDLKRNQISRLVFMLSTLFSGPICYSRLSTSYVATLIFIGICGIGAYGFHIMVLNSQKKIKETLESK